MDFLKWLLDFLLASLYPGSPNARKGFAAETLLQLLESLSSDPQGHRDDEDQASGLTRAPELPAWLLQQSIVEPKSVLAILGEHPVLEICSYKEAA